MNVQLARKCFSQSFILACPGVLFGTCLTATVGKYILPYSWEWPIAMVFGAILSATDPVAVVALFKSLGVSPRLTMLISGESLLNDGTAIVLFQLFLKISLGATPTWRDVLIFVAHMTVTAVVIGFLVGSMANYMIGQCCGKHYHSDSMIQAVITICAAYFAFFLAENEFSTSGVLATVTAGVVVANSAWPCIVSRETIHTVWETIEFVGNTLVFFVAGLIFGDICLSRSGVIQLMDYAYLLVLYFVVTGIRMLMVAIMLVPLNKAGRPIKLREAVVIVWSGLRGAVGLAMAIIVDQEPDIDLVMGSRIMFHVGGIAALTTLINASTTSKLLSMLGVVKTHKLQKKTIDDMEVSMSNNVRALFNSHLQSRVEDDVRFSGADPDLVSAWVPLLQVNPERHEEAKEWTAKEEAQRFTLYRQIFLNVVQKEYWDAIHDGILPRRSGVTQVLLDSTNEARDSANLCLSDWNVVERIFGEKPSTNVIQRIFLHLRMPFLRRGAPDNSHICQSMLSFIQAHTRAQEQVPLYFGKGDPLVAHIQQQVNSESEHQCHMARQHLAELPPEAIVYAKSQMLAQRILDMQKDEVEMWKQKGVLTENEATHLADRVNAHLRQLSQ